MSSRSASTCPGVRVAWDNRRARQHLASLCSRRSSPLSKGVMPVARMFTTLFLSQINSGSNCRAVCLAELLSGPQTKLCLCCMAFRPLRALCRSFCTSGEKPSRGPRGLSQDPDPDCPGDVGAVTAGSLPDALSQHCVSSPVTGRLPAAEGGWPGGVSGHPGAELRARRRTTLALRGGTALLTGSRQVLPRAFGHSPLGDREVLSLWGTGRCPSPHLVFWNPPSYRIPMLRSDSSFRWPELRAADTGHCPQQLAQLGCFCSLGANARPALFSVTLQCVLLLMLRSRHGTRTCLFSSPVSRRASSLLYFLILLFFKNCVVLW